jgi:hypothetical protein
VISDLRQTTVFCHSREGGNPDLESCKTRLCMALRGSVWIPAFAGITAA